MTYTYECENCGKFEIVQSMKDDPLKTCPKCKAKVKRVYTANVNLNFNGSYNSTRK